MNGVDSGGPIPEILIPNAVEADGLDGRPQTFVQWKGTDVCVDVWCPCGEGGHFDGYFMYAFRCPACQRTWEVAPRLLLREVTDDMPQQFEPITLEIDND